MKDKCKQKEINTLDYLLQKKLCEKFYKKLNYNVKNCSTQENNKLPKDIIRKIIKYKAY